MTLPYSKLPQRYASQDDVLAGEARAEPYTGIVEELPEMRAQTVELVRQAVKQGVRSYVLVNNRAEGNAPMTVQALANRLRE